LVSLRRKDHSEYLRDDDNLILKPILRKQYMDRIYLASDGDRCWAVVKAVIGLRLQQNGAIFALAE
jgi:hypothetical protein